MNPNGLSWVFLLGVIGLRPLELLCIQKKHLRKYSKIQTKVDTKLNKPLKNARGKKPRTKFEDERNVKEKFEEEKKFKIMQPSVCTLLGLYRVSMEPYKARKTSIEACESLIETTLASRVQLDPQSLFPDGGGKLT